MLTLRGAVAVSLLVGIAIAARGEPMQFALRFKTQSINGVNHGVAESQSLVSEIRDGASWFDVMISASGGRARWTSVLVDQTNSSWSEKGNVTFDDTAKDVLFFASPGLAGHALNPNWGGIVYNVTGGIGRFDGATGVMVDTFWNPTGNSSVFFINAWAMVFTATSK